MSTTLFRSWSRAVVLWLLLGSVSPASENLLVNGDFEQGRDAWNDLWTRTAGGELSVDETHKHGGRRAVRLQHTGTEDWSFDQTQQLDVKPGQIYEYSAWLRGAGEGSATLCVTLRDEGGKVLSWSFGGQSAASHGAWRQVKTRFAIPADGRTIQPRLIGYGPSVVWLDDAILALRGSLDDLRAANLPSKLQLENSSLKLSIDVPSAALTVLDRRTRRTWQQKPSPGDQPIVVLSAEQQRRVATLKLLDPVSMLELEMSVVLTDSAPEILVKFSGDGELQQPLRYPRPFSTAPGQSLIMPVNEGISYPVDDDTLPAMSYHLYGGHGLCMPWYGVIDGSQGMMTIVHTPDDAVVDVPRRNGRLCQAPGWVPQKGRFGGLRSLRYVFIDDGGYVAMCKRYRELVRGQAGLVTLAQKQQRVASVDRLIGAVNVWCWEKDAVALCREMQSLGMERILWSRRADAETVRALNEMGVLTSRYDIYQDVMDPAQFKNLRGVHPDWPTDAWPDDLTIDAQGRRQGGWKVRGRDGQFYPCGVLCDRQAVAYARERIAAELKTHSYQCRFIDTTTASPWRECYHPEHPMTRSESRHWKMGLLRLVSDEFKLVTGSETGHDAAAPYVHYFEGMMSLGPYRVPDAGRDMMRIVEDPPERVAKFQTGHFNRLPLWELVYHDCVVAGWYWGDYNNKLPKLWDRRDLWNALYGTPPMFMFHRKIWEEHQQRFLQSYRTATPVARATGYSEMLSHRWLTADHGVQQTEFAGGITVTVNFGNQPYRMKDGTQLAALSHVVVGMDD